MKKDTEHFFFYVHAVSDYKHRIITLIKNTTMVYGYE